MARLLLTGWLWLAFSLSLLAQPETYNWRFAGRAGLVFAGTGPPTATTSSIVPEGGEGCTSISDAAGHLRCYSNGVQVWDRTDAPMPNGGLRSNIAAVTITQGALLPNPGNAQEYYLFTLDAFNPALGNYGLRYSVIEMGLRGGLGDIGTRKNITLPLPGGQTLLTERLTAAPLPNGRDYWILVHGLNTNRFYNFLLTPAGVQPVPVVSSVGAVNRLYSGYTRFSPDGRQLAVPSLVDKLELFDFDNASGRLTLNRAIAVPNVPPPNFPDVRSTYYGLEFSADGSKLYTTNVTATAFITPAQGLYQIDLANRDALTFLGLDNNVEALLRGPDNRIYVAQYTSDKLSVVTTPNAAGLACGVLPQSFALAPGSRCGVGLPNFAAPLAPVRAVLSADSRAICLGSPATFSAAVVSAAPNALYTWDFGDPAAGAANAATGASASHQYAAAGTYLVTLAAATPGGTLTARQTLVVAPPPTLRLGPAPQLLCPGQPLSIGDQRQPAGTTYRWRDGPTTATRAVPAPGRYVLTVTSPQGCAATDSVEVRTTADCAGLLVPNIITPNGDGQNDAFVLGGLVATDWMLAVYNRWGREVFRQAGYDNSWTAAGQSAGQCYYLLVNPDTGARLQGWVEVIRIAARERGPRAPTGTRGPHAAGFPPESARHSATRRCWPSRSGNSPAPALPRSGG